MDNSKMYTSKVLLVSDRPVSFKRWIIDDYSLLQIGKMDSQLYNIYTASPADEDEGRHEDTKLHFQFSRKLDPI